MTRPSSPIHSTALALAAIGSCLAPASLLAHDPGAPHSHAEVTSVPLNFITETKGPVSAPARTTLPAGTKISGQGFWKFVAARDKVPVPPDALPKIKGAHGTLVVDHATDTVYWGLQDVGWISFTEKASKSAIASQDPLFKGGNLHGADLLPRAGKSPLIVAADNVRGAVYVTDTSFQHPQVLKTPNLEPYSDGKGYAPTDAAFEGSKRIWVTDGYGKAWFMPATLEPLAFEGHAYGGKSFSGTPHGITYNPETHMLILSARPEGLVKTWNPKTQTLTDIGGLPAGSTVCDVDVWGDYALAPCLDGTKGAAGPIYIINLKKKAVVATIKPKADLGYEDAQHIHDACWYVTGKGSKREVYILYTNWNPGGVGALKLVNVAD